MDIAVTGASGFIGKHLALAHLARGDRVRALSRGRLSDIVVQRTILSFLLCSAAALTQAVEAPPYAALLQAVSERTAQ